MNASDHSDNNNAGEDIDPTFVRKHGRVDLVILKLYPGTKPVGSGHDGWTFRQYRALKDDFAIGFYAADSTPSWADAKDVIVNDLGLDPKEHPFAFDLFEFGKSDDFVRGEIAKAQAEGVKVGNYRSRGSPYQQLGADWRWVADTVFPAGETPIAFDLHQHNAIDGWGDQSMSSLTLDGFLDLTTSREAQEMPQFTDAEEAVLKTLIADEAVLKTLIPIADSMVRLAGHEAQTTGHTLGLIARFQEKTDVSLPPPATVDGQDSGPYFRQGWAAMDAAIVSGAVEI